mgnify:CR=1 FL=1
MRDRLLFVQALETVRCVEEGVLLSPQDNFLLMFLLPHEVDYLRLGDNYRQVDQLKDGAWISTRVNP